MTGNWLRAIPLGSILTGLLVSMVTPTLAQILPAPGAVNKEFYFGAGSPPSGFVQALPQTVYSRERGYGFEQPVQASSQDKERAALCSDKPFLFSVAVPEGNYNVTVTLGDRSVDSFITIKAEARRLMLENIHASPGHLQTRAFTVNVRVPQITNGGEVQLKPRELASFDWDGKLTLEFNGIHPCVSRLEISSATTAITVFLAGDSTVVDQTSEPWAAWGQMLPRFFGPEVAIANHAESGESLKSFMYEHRLEKILSAIKPGDYLFIQFAHNDQKPGKMHVDAFTTYKAYLKVLIAEARQRGAIPVLVTSMHRRSFAPDGTITNTLLDYPEAMRQTSREDNAALVDLNAMSKLFYEALGPEGSVKAFVHYPAGSFPGQAVALSDNTHFNAYGAYELARCIVEGVRNNHLGISAFLTTNVPFDPSHPDPVREFNLPPSPFLDADTPLGSR